ncbi:hypothetical protein BD413DRAFT_88151 [Trametes elegans]|nr:hypothetical protein BD413DRAFT_88151 [Trametes elegans]
MYDPRPMFPEMYHPRVRYRSRDWKRSVKYFTRTVRPVRYHYIDFGLSRKFNPEDGPPRAVAIRGGDKTVPEFQHWDGEPLDPFPTDIYYLGNMIREIVFQEFKGAKFLSPLVEDMVQDDPSKRPTIQEVVQRYNDCLRSVGPWKLRSRLVPRKESICAAFVRSVVHYSRTARYALTRKPPIPPTPPPA